MQFRLLGPVEAWAGDHPVPLGALKQRHLLAALCFDGAHPITFDTLIDRLWDDEPPVDARGALYGYVARLRRCLRDDSGVTLDRWSGGYTLRVPSAAVDLFQFRTLLERARTAGDVGARAAALDEALGLWRGDALAGLPGAWAQRARDGLARQRVSAVADWAGAAVAQGRPGVAIDRLAAELAGTPLCEPLIAVLMRALHAAGRTPEALDFFARSRALIADELGVEPGRLLRDAHTDILRQPEPPAPPRPARPQPPAGVPVPPPPERPPPSSPPAEAGRPSGPFLLPPDLPDYTGHAEQVAAACAALRDTGAAPVVVLSGQGGAGKSALAVHIAHRLRARFPDGQVFLNVGGADPLEPPEALSRALRALGVTDPDAQGSPDLRERVARYRATLAGRRILLIVDDAAGARQVLPFLPGDAGSALLVTSRLRLTTVPATARVEVGVLSVAEARLLLARMIGAERTDAEPVETTRLIGLCARLPLAVRVAGARLAARPHWSVRRLADRLSDERSRLDELCLDDLEVRASLAISYQGLRSRAQVAFQALGCLDPPDFTALTVAALLDTDLDDACDLVEEITDARLLDVMVADGLCTRYRMHDLVRLYAGELIRDRPQEQRTRVVQTLAAMQHAVERLGEQLPVATPRMYEPSDLPTPSARWVEAIAGIDLRHWFDGEESALIAAVERAAALGLTESAGGLADALIFASFATRNNFDGWERAHTAAAAAARKAGNRPAEAAMECGIGQLRYAQDRFAESRAHFSAAATLFEAAGDDRGLAVALNGLGTVGRELSEHLVALPQINRALLMLEHLGDDAGVAHAHYSLGFVHRELGADEEALHHLAAALSRYRRLGHRRGELISIRGMGLVHRARGELAAAEDRCAQAHAIATAIGDEHLAAYTAQALAKVWVRQGRPDEAAEPLAAALTTMVALRDSQGTALVTRTVGELHLAAGRLDAAAEQLRRAAELWQAIDMDLGHARTLRDLGAVDAARGEHAAAHQRWSAALVTFRRLAVREKDELSAWRAVWGCVCPADQISAAASASASTLSTLPPASAASSPSDQCRAASSRNSPG